jgi:ataxin-3
MRLNPDESNCPGSTQLAFILNYQQHWFTLRRFGPAVANLDLDPGDGHWFNLNSFLPAPEWVGKLYLGMVLQQAEADGMFLFTSSVRQSNELRLAPQVTLFSQ